MAARINYNAALHWTSIHIEIVLLCNQIHTYNRLSLHLSANAIVNLADEIYNYSSYS